MLFCKIERTTTITVDGFKDLMAAWRMHGGPASLVGRFIVRERLTKSQLRRLPSELRRRVQSPDDSIAFLERMYLLVDPRG